MDLKHEMTRGAFSLALDAALKYYKGKDQEGRTKSLMKMVDVAEKLMGDTYPKFVYNNMRDLISHPESKWMQFMFKSVDELDPNVLKMHVLNLAYEAGLAGMKKCKENEAKYDCNVPWLILMDPTSACNLKCTGCWAAEYGHKLQLTNEDLDRVVTQAKELGTHFFILTGGEPMVRKNDIVWLAKKHHDCAFHLFTNGTLIDEEFCENAQKLGNISMALSIEGYEETNDDRRGVGVFQRVMHSMDLMKQYGLLYGASCCYTSKNYDVVTSDKFLDMLIDKGCRLVWYFHYMPVGKDASLELLPTNKQRAYMFHRIREIRDMEGGKSIFAMDFQNDGEFVDGCIAGGKNYLHINAKGDVEPCVFIHYSSANIKEVSLLEALQQPLFKAYRKHQPFNENMLRPCPMLENPEFLRQMVAETGAKSTEMIEPESAEDLCNKTAEYAARWKPEADKLWAERAAEREEQMKAREIKQEELNKKFGKK